MGANGSAQRAKVRHAEVVSGKSSSCIGKGGARRRRLNAGTRDDVAQDWCLECAFKQLDGREKQRLATYRVAPPFSTYRQWTPCRKPLSSLATNPVRPSRCSTSGAYSFPSPSSVIHAAPPSPHHRFAR